MTQRDRDMGICRKRCRKYRDSEGEKEMLTDGEDKDQESKDIGKEECEKCKEVEMTRDRG